MCGLANTGLHGYAEMDGTVRWEKRDCSGGRVSLRTIDDNDAPDPGGKRALGGRPPAWRQPKGGTHGARWTPNAQGFPALGSLTPDEEKRRDHSVPEFSDVVVARDTMEPSLPSELGRGCMAPLGRNVGVLQQGMRLAGVIGPARQVAPVGVLDVKRKSAGRGGRVISHDGT